MARASRRALAETDLYQPIHDYLVAQGYTVRGEVRNCDITAVKGDDVIVVEMKRAFGIPLLMQATQRQRITDSVYVALPREAMHRGVGWQGTRHLLRRLELGLMLVSLKRAGGGPSVEVVFHPLPFERKKRRHLKRAVIREAEGRSADLNVGGSRRRKIVTAYRENAIRIACCLDACGPSSPRQLRALGTGPRTLPILASDVYGWFERIARGVYALRPGARAELAQYPELVKRLREEVKARLGPELWPGGR